MILLFLTLACTCQADPVLSQEVRDQLEAQMRDTCGRSCSDLLSEILPILGTIDVTPESTPADLAKEFSLFNDFLNKVVSNGREKNMAILSDLHSLSISSFANATVGGNATIPPSPAANFSNMLVPPPPGTPCSIQSDCDLLDFKMNRCAYIRQQAMNAYVGANAALSMMATLITALCGCLFVGPAKVCVISAIPYVCGFPFTAYQGIYGVSMSLWAAVTITSSVCTAGGLT